MGQALRTCIASQQFSLESALIPMVRVQVTRIRPSPFLTRRGAPFGPRMRTGTFHIMNMISNQINYVETFGFSTTKENHIINYYYEHAKDIFYRFKFYFLDKASNIIKIAENNRMILPYVRKNNDSTPERAIGIKNKLIKAMDIKKLHICDIRGEDVVITKKELECIKWMMLGKSSSEIAMIMGVGLTTVNTHIKNIKTKIGLFKIGQLIKFFCKNQFDCLYN